MARILPTLTRVARAYDNSAISLQAVGERIWQAGYTRGKTACMNDPEYARLEALRVDDRDPDRTVFLDQAKGLGLPQAQYQRELLHARTPQWAYLGLRLSRVQLARALGQVDTRVSRARKGWAPRDAWNAGHHLARVASGMLDHLARHAHSWPGESPQYPTPEAWSAELARHADTLARYGATDPEYDQALNHWHTLATNPSTCDTEEEQQARQRLDDLEAARQEEAQASLHWIADHLPDLWD